MLLDASDIFCCTHEWDEELAHWVCIHCGVRTYDKNPRIIIGPGRVALFESKTEYQARKAKECQQKEPTKQDVTPEQ